MGAGKVRVGVEMIEVGSRTIHTTTGQTVEGAGLEAEEEETVVDGVGIEEKEEEVIVEVAEEVAIIAVAAVGIGVAVALIAAVAVVGITAVVVIVTAFDVN